VIYVARQLGHDARLTLSTYGHVIDELDELPRQDAEGVHLYRGAGLKRLGRMRRSHRPANGGE